jgi:hypothetical protein
MTLEEFNRLSKPDTEVQCASCKFVIDDVNFEPQCISCGSFTFKVFRKTLNRGGEGSERYRYKTLDYIDNMTLGQSNISLG